MSKVDDECVVLVTGGAGYIGAVLVPSLVAAGYRVRVLDRLLFGGAGLEPIAESIELVVGDVRRPPPDLFEGVGAVIHLAALSNDPMADFHPQANHDLNAVAAEQIACAAREHGVRRFIQASSCAIYDRGVIGGDEPRDETSDVHPTAFYAVAKRAAEEGILALAGRDFHPAIVRKGTVYGYSPRMRYDLVVNTFVKDALATARLTVHHGEMCRPLVDVRDVADAYLALLDAPEATISGEIFNLVYDNYLILDLANAVAAALKDEVAVAVAIEYEGGKARSYRVSGDKLRTAVGFRPGRSVGDSARDMVRRIRQNQQTDFSNPRYYNIDWFKVALEVEQNLRQCGPMLHGADL